MYTANTMSSAFEALVHFMAVLSSTMANPHDRENELRQPSFQPCAIEAVRKDITR
jgi:dihydroxyacid dehydratase/phosphogluconate dehydratase